MFRIKSDDPTLRTMNDSRLLLAMLAALVLVGCGTTDPDYTTGKSATCEVHRVTMTRTSVPIMYGLPLWNDKTTARSTASARLFPHAGDPPEGGCFVDSHNPKQATVFVCPDCQHQAREWNLAYDLRH